MILTIHKNIITPPRIFSPSSKSNNERWKSQKTAAKFTPITLEWRKIKILHTDLTTHNFSIPETKMKEAQNKFKVFHSHLLHLMLSFALLLLSPTWTAHFLYNRCTARWALEHHLVFINSVIASPHAYLINKWWIYLPH